MAREGPSGALTLVWKQKMVTEMDTTAVMIDPPFTSPGPSHCLAPRNQQGGDSSDLETQFSDFFQEGFSG